MEGQEQNKSASPKSWQPAAKGRGRLFAAYTVVALMALIAIAAIILLSSESDSVARGDPHINLKSGTTNGIAFDTRAGIEPPELEDQSPLKAARAAGCELHMRLPDEGHEHIPASAPEPQYRTKPPTSGRHVDEQQADGAYRKTPPPVSVVHSLEHGRLAIQYRPDLPEVHQRELLGLFGNIYGGTLLFPSNQLPYEVAAVTWTNLLGCDRYRGKATVEAVLAFGKATWGRYGGEPALGLNSKAPTPALPSR